MKADKNIVDAAWRRTLANELNGNILMDSAKGRTAFACGVAFALGRLREHGGDPEYRRLWDDAKSFVEAYMAKVA